MFDFLFCKKAQHERVLDLLLKKGTVTSLELSQMHPVILNFHQAIHRLKEMHDIETVVELVKGIKHTSYIYHGRLAIPCRHQREKKYTKEEMIECWNASQRKDAPNAEAYLQTIHLK